MDVTEAVGGAEQQDLGVGYRRVQCVDERDGSACCHLDCLGSPSGRECGTAGFVRRAGRFGSEPIAGGAGSAVAEALHAAGLTTPVLMLGLKDEFIEHGDPAKLLSLQGLDAAGIERSVLQRFGTKLELDAIRGDFPAFFAPAIDLRGVQAMQYQGMNVVSSELELTWRLSRRWSLLAFGGVGGSSPFGSKAGDAFTRFTIYVAAFWLLFIMIQVRIMNGKPSTTSSLPVRTTNQ